jgi:ABC-type nitrate/sulfonate/bicarbonate transport system substrate-binding protein
LEGHHRPVALALIHGFPMVAFAGGCTYSKQSPTRVLVVAKSGPIHTARDLEGQTIAVPSTKSLNGEPFLSDAKAEQGARRAV